MTIALVEYHLLLEEYNFPLNPHVMSVGLSEFPESALNFNRNAPIGALVLLYSGGSISDL